MRTRFVPQKLNRSLVEVIKKHPLRATPAEYKGDQDFTEMLKRWAYMQEDAITQEAPLIPPRRLRQLVEYVGSNIYNFPMRNFATIIKIRITDDVFRRLFSIWLDSFESSDYNELLKFVARSYRRRSENVFQNSQLEIPLFLDWLGSENIPITVGKTCLQIKEKTNSFEDALQKFSVSSESLLGKACVENFYTFCTREDYMLVSDFELERVIRRYNEKKVRAYLRNFLSVLVVEDFQCFYVTGKYLVQKYTDIPGTKRFFRFFTGYPQELISKYQRWLNYITIRDSFHNNTADIRLIFWSKFVPYMQYAHMEPISRSLLMQFEKYGIVEFTEATMGALYIYEIDDFNNRIQPLARTMNNTEFRSYLFNSPQVNRIVHNGNWQYKTERYLRRAQIAKR